MSKYKPDDYKKISLIYLAKVKIMIMFTIVKQMTIA